MLASEFTDFTRPLHKHSYQACLDTIEQADLFVLFVGKRVGGWFDEPAKVSITRQEYRHAFDLARQSRMRLLCFVRAEVFNHRQSVRDLEKALKSDPALDDAQRTRLANHPSMAMENAEAIISFIDEITRNGETVAASKGLASAPVANWIMPFSTFAEVRQAIDPLIAHGLTIPQAAGRKALEVQLVQLLKDVLPVIHDKAINPVNSALKLRRELDIQADCLTSNITISGDLWSQLVFMASISAGVNVDPAPLLGALRSELLLRYDPVAGVYEQTEEYSLLAHVVDQARKFAAAPTMDGAELFKHGRSKASDQSRTVPTHVIVSWMHRVLRWVDLIGSARALASSLAGKKMVPPPEVPASPIIDQEDQLRAEAATEEQVRDFIDNLA